MKFYDSGATIAASPDAVWSVLTGGAGYATSGGDGGTHFRMWEEYSGPLLGVMWKSMPDLGLSFAKFAAGLKTQAEQANRQA